MIAGIVCEYNPFHNGHLYHIKKTREAGADFIVCVMSGNFVQRGECAHVDKWLRAKAAVLCGADVVIELPTPFSCASAETFARGSVGLLMNFGVDMLSFGCEDEDKELLIKCAEAAEDKAAADIIKSETAKGATYPAAMQKAISSLYGESCAEAIASPNNTLAVEYIRQLSLYGKENCIIPIKRQGADHDSEKTSGSFASASKLRRLPFGEKWKTYVPLELFGLYDAYEPYSLAYSERAILSRLRSMPKEEYALYVSDDTGLASRIYQAAKTADSLVSLYDKAKSKNFTMSRVRREVLNAYLGVKRQWSEGLPPYIKILAANERGLSLLAEAKDKTSLPIITKHAEAEKLTLRAKEIYEAECRNTDLFSLMSQKIGVCHLEETHSVTVVR
ncbi:MAG: nucleotidyltransferase family protein [Clostridia bacterium]|nr:nucleotidyltransferase family protein [Clostridia bacterium]